MDFAQGNEYAEYSLSRQNAGNIIKKWIEA